MKQILRKSGFGDYIAVDFVDSYGNILKTPFYISNGREVEVHWGRPSNERCENPINYDDFVDKYLFRMINGELFVRWLNGPCSHMEQFDKLEAANLLDWKFQYAHKVCPAVKIPESLTTN